MTLGDILQEADFHPDPEEALDTALVRLCNWPHEETYAVVDGKCQVCGYEYESAP